MPLIGGNAIPCEGAVVFTETVNAPGVATVATTGCGVDDKMPLTAGRRKRC